MRAELPIKTSKIHCSPTSKHKLLQSFTTAKRELANKYGMNSASGLTFRNEHIQQQSFHPRAYIGHRSSFHELIPFVMINNSTPPKYLPTDVYSPATNSQRESVGLWCWLTLSRAFTSIIPNQLRVKWKRPCQPATESAMKSFRERKVTGIRLRCLDSHAYLSLSNPHDMDYSS